MPRPHPPELRQRVVDAYLKEGGTYAEVAARFNVGEASVSRWLALVRRTGDVAAKPMGGARRHRKLTPEAIAHIVSLIRDEPNWTTTELAEEVEDVFEICVSRHAVGRVLRREGMTFKRGSSDRQLPRALG